MTFEHLHEYVFFLILAQVITVAFIRAARLRDAENELPLDSVIARVILHAGAVAIVTNSIILGMANGFVYLILCYTTSRNSVYIHFCLQIVWAWIAWSTVNPQGSF
jgi:hypothetical protein